MIKVHIKMICDTCGNVFAFEPNMTARSEKGRVLYDMMPDVALVADAGWRVVDGDDICAECLFKKS